MNSFIFILLIVAYAGLLLELLYIIIRKNTMNKLISTLFERNEEKFDKISRSLLAKTLSKFDILCIKFRVYQITNNSQKMPEAIEAFDKIELSKGQKKKIYPKIFMYYMDSGKYGDAKNYYERVKDLGTYKGIEDVEIFYDAYINNGYEHLDYALKRVKRIDLEEKPSLENAIGRMYENKKIKAEAKKYYNLAKQHQMQLEKKR